MLAAALKTEVEALAPEDARLLRGLSRFRDPAIERAAQLRGSPKARQEIESLWWQLRKSPEEAATK